MNLADAIDECFYASIVEGRSPQTIRCYRKLLTWLRMYAHSQGVTTLAGLTPRLLQGAALVMLDANNPARHFNFKGGQANVRGLFTAAHFLERWAKAQGIAMPDLSSLKMPRVPERVQPRVTAAEFKALEHAALHRPVRLRRFTSARDLALIYLLADTGLRIHEVCALDLADVDLAHGEVIVRRGKGGKGRALSIVDADPGAIGGGPTMVLLRLYVVERAQRHNADKQTAFWVSNKGVRLSREALFRIMRRLCAAAGLKGSRPPHAFRRASFSEQYNTDPSALPVLAARMGWASMETKMIGVYTRGANIDMARTQPRPSIARKWRGGPALPGVTPTVAPQPAPRFDGVLSSELVAAIQNNPELVRALLNALNGAA